MGFTGTRSIVSVKKRRPTCSSSNANTPYTSPRSVPLPPLIAMRAPTVRITKPSSPSSSASTSTPASRAASQPTANQVSTGGLSRSSGMSAPVTRLRYRHSSSAAYTALSGAPWATYTQ